MRDLHLPGRSPCHAQRGMVASSHSLASLAGVDMMRAGGNAIDAAVATAAAQAVLEPAMTSAGGDVFALVAKSGADVVGVNASGKAAAGSDAEKLRGQGWSSMQPDHGMSVTVPGAVAGWANLVTEHGKLGLDTVLAPAIDLAQNGWPVSQRVAFDWSQNVGRLSANPGSAKHYLRKDGSAPVAGDLMVQPELGATLKAIAENGPDAFYQGAVAEDICAAIQAAGGVMTLDDLASVSVDPMTPIESAYRDVTLIELPPNTHGIAAQIMLRILEGFDTRNMDPYGAERFHLQMEAARLAYAVRDAHIGDPGSMSVTEEELLGDAFIDRLRARIDPNQRMASPGDVSLPGSDTVIIAVIDEDRNAVALINSVFKDFGSSITAPKSGVLLQNRGAAFNLTAGHANELAAGKRPLHTLIPGLIRTGSDISHAFGVMGGQYQACGHAHVVQNMTDFGMDPQEALDCPRIFMDGFGSNDPLTGERSVPAGTVEGLLARGHRFETRKTPWGGGQIIAIDAERGTLIGGSDPRKDGIALGY